MLDMSKPWQEKLEEAKEQLKELERVHKEENGQELF